MTDDEQRQAASDKRALLDRIGGPEDLKGLSDDELQALAQEVRDLIIDVIGEIGGHFGANLGACELSVALHSLLDSPRDKILWDVGHQAYPHKILTGRRDRLPTIRQYDGLAPFCSIFESEHDIMGAGHASTSIGYAVGLKEAMRKGIGADGKVAAVIGDGALTGGCAADRPVIVHIHTVKGKGFTPAEEGGLESMEEWHAAKPNSIVEGRPAVKEPKPVPVTETDSPEGIELLERPPAASSPP